MNSHPRSLTKNFIYSIINTVSGLLFPLFTFPYATRVLMPEGIGQVNFYNSIIAYVTLLVGMGIPTYGIREIARVRDNKEELTRVTIEPAIPQCFPMHWGISNHWRSMLMD